MTRLHDLKRNPFSAIGGILGITCIVLILLLFVFNLLIGGWEEIINILLYYLIPLLLILSLILLTISKLKEAGVRRHKRKTKSIHHHRGRHSENP
jgi:uncharacterized membrane protein